MQRAKDADHLASYSDTTYPVGPDASGRITYVHYPPLNPLTVVVIALVCTAIAAFFCCYFYPAVQQCSGARTTKDHHVKRPVLASARSLFGLRPQSPPGTPLLARHGGPEMRIAWPPPVLRVSRGKFLSPSLSRTLSYSSSSPRSPTPTETPPMYSQSAISEVIVAPVDMGIMGQAVESRTTPKKGDYYDARKVEDE